MYIIPSERDEKVRYSVHLSLGEGSALGQAVHRVEGRVKQSGGVVSITEVMAVAGQER